MFKNAVQTMSSLTAPPLSGIKVVEFAGLAPGPFCGIFLADWGASVIRIDKTNQRFSSDILARGKRSIALNLKSNGGVQLAKKLIAEADVLIDPFRPSVLEKLGLGPEAFLGENGLNRKLVYTRVVGFARRGHHKNMAGHDLNYLAVSGILSIMNRSSDGRPTFPLNILADFAGGGHMAASGVLLALFERSRSGFGQVVENDMVSGARYLASMPLTGRLLGNPLFSQSPGSNMLDGGSPFYNVYTCKDGRFMTIGALEPEFYAVFVKTFLPALPKGFKVAGLKGGEGWVPRIEKQVDRSEWEDLSKFIEEGFKTRTMEEWTKVFDGKDACVVPVLTPEEAAAHTNTLSHIPQPHPDLSRTPAPGSLPGSSTEALAASLNIPPGTHTEEVLAELGFSKEEQIKLAKEGAIDKVTKAAL